MGHSFAAMYQPRATRIPVPIREFPFTAALYFFPQSNRVERPREVISFRDFKKICASLSSSSMPLPAIMQCIESLPENYDRSTNHLRSRLAVTLSSSSAVSGMPRMLITRCQLPFPDPMSIVNDHVLFLASSRHGRHFEGSRLSIQASIGSAYERTLLTVPTSVGKKSPFFSVAFR
jgi:hypothetical protein